MKKKSRKSLAYYVGYYQSRVLKVMKRILIVALVLALIYVSMRLLGISVEIKMNGADLWQVR